jgi:hypothetical protein
MAQKPYEELTKAEGTLCDVCHDWTPLVDMVQLENGTLQCCFCDRLLMQLMHEQRIRSRCF